MATADEQLLQARTTAATLSDQLNQARADLHRLGIADQNRALVYAAGVGALGLLVGVAVGIHASKKK